MITGKKSEFTKNLQKKNKVIEEVAVTEEAVVTEEVVAAEVAEVEVEIIDKIMKIDLNIKRLPISSLKKTREARLNYLSKSARILKKNYH
jgi:transposase